MTAEWCAQLYQHTVDKWVKPQIVHTDQGSQYTSQVFVNDVLKNEQTQLSMDGKGRATDNAFIERLWRTVYIYLHDFYDGKDLAKGLDYFFNYYNFDRDHSALKPSLPCQH